MRAQALPRAVTDLWFALDGVKHSASARRVRQVVLDAMSGPNPKAGLNMGLRRLSGRKAALHDVRRWLDSGPVGVAARRGGAHWALVEWRRALDAILIGATPHVAFGMATPGRRPHTGFSICDNLAAYIEHRHRAGDRDVDIMGDVARIMKNRTPDPRTLRFARRKLGSLSDANVGEMAAWSRGRYCLP